MQTTERWLEGEGSMNNNLLLKMGESLDSDRLSLSELAAEINNIISQHELSEQLD